MTALLGVPGEPCPVGSRGTASVNYCDDPHGESVGVDVDGGPDEVLPAAIRYHPAEHPPAMRVIAAETMIGTLAEHGWEPLGPIVWGPEDFCARVEKVRPTG